MELLRALPLAILLSIEVSAVIELIKLSKDSNKKDN